MTRSAPTLRSVTPEDRLWRALKKRRDGLCRFRRHAGVGPHTVDFLLPGRRLVVEVDCAPLRTEAARAAAAKRAGDIEASGYRIVRLWADHIETHLEGAVAIIAAAVTAEKGWSRSRHAPARSVEAAAA